jgi:phenylacetate-coenzyme A ligase PaaK-like adenylate-forming protein
MKDAILRADAQAVRREQDARLSATLDLVFAGSPFYRARFAALGLQRGDITGIADLHKLPITTKADFVGNARDFVMEIPDAPIEMRMPWEVLYTTGSSGNPTPFQSNAYDFYNILTSYRRMLTLRGVGPDDVLANLYPVTQYPQGAYIRVMNAASALHIPVVALLPGRPSAYFDEGSSRESMPAVLARTGVTTIWGVPSFVRSVLKTAEAQGIALPRLRHLLLSGEPMTEAARADIVAVAAGIGATDATVKASYGATELQAGLVECCPGAGFHNVAPEQFFFEIVDPDTGISLPDGAEGLVVFTHLDRRGTVLLRYAVGDVAVLSHAPCPHCDLTVDRIVSAPRRADQRMKIRGMLVDTDVLIAATEAALGGREFLFRVARQDENDPFSMDLLELLIAGEADAGPIAAAVKTASGITPTIRFVAEDRIVDPGRAWKIKRLIDERPR